MTDPGHRVLPGDGPLLPPMPLPPELPADGPTCGCLQCRQPGYVEDGRGNVWPKCSLTCDMQIVRPGKVQCSCDAQSGSSEGEVIPPEAVEDAAKAFWVEETHEYRPTWEQLAQDHPDRAEWYRASARAMIAAALPHLRAFQIETQVRVGYELGRREAGEEIAAMLEAVPGKIYPEDIFTPDGTTVDAQTARVMRFAYPAAARMVRDLIKGDSDD